MSARVGRELKLTRVLTLTDEGGEFFFRYPRNLKVAAGGSFFIQDREGLYQFDSEGILLRNYFKKGQGPGESEGMSSYHLTEDSLIIHDNRRHKMIWFNFNGELVKEIQLQQQVRFLRFLFLYGGNYYFLRSGIPSVSGGSGYTDLPRNIIAYSHDGTTSQQLMDFPVPGFAAVSGGSRGSISLCEFINTPFGGKYLLISHTPEYLVKLFDVELNKVVLEFKREYKRRKSPKAIKERGKGSIGIGGKQYEVPYPEYLDDIRNILVFGDNWWVITSAFEEDRGYLVDVFNPDGRYIDCFWLKLADKTDFRTLGFYQLTVCKDYLYHIHRTEDDLYEVIMYKTDYGL
jgi:hypothetical protein